MEKALRLALPMGFDVRLLVLPLEEDPDTWCLKLGAQAFKELVGNAPDWTSFIIDRALDGKDFRRTTDRMEALRDLAEFLVHLPSTPERRELFASLAHQLQIPLQELDRAIKARLAARCQPGGGPGDGPAAKVEVDDLLKPLLRLCRDGGGPGPARGVPPSLVGVPHGSASAPGHPGCGWRWRTTFPERPLHNCGTSRPPGRQKTKPSPLLARYS